MHLCPNCGIVYDITCSNCDRTYSYFDDGEDKMCPNCSRVYNYSEHEVCPFCSGEINVEHLKRFYKDCPNCNSIMR